MDSLNSLAFGGEPPRKEYLMEPANGKDAPLLSKTQIKSILWSTFTFCGIFAILAGLNARGVFVSESTYMSARFALLIIMAVMNGFVVRTKGWNIFAGLRNNLMFIYVAFGILLSTVLAVSFGGAFLQLHPLNLTQWLIVFGLSILVVPINILYKQMVKQ